MVEMDLFMFPFRAQPKWANGMLLRHEHELGFIEPRRDGQRYLWYRGGNYFTGKSLEVALNSFKYGQNGSHFQTCSLLEGIHSIVTEIVVSRLGKKTQ